MFVLSLKDSSIESKKYSSLVDLKHLYGCLYLKCFSTMSLTSPTRLQIHNLCMIMNIKIEIKRLLQDCGMSYQQYQLLIHNNELFGNVYEMFNLNSNSVITIKFNDFPDFSPKSMQNCITIENFEYYINNKFIPSLETTDTPDVRLSYEDFTINY